MSCMKWFEIDFINEVLDRIDNLGLEDRLTIRHMAESARNDADGAYEGLYKQVDRLLGKIENEVLSSVEDALKDSYLQVPVKSMIRDLFESVDVDSITSAVIDEFVKE